MGLELALYQELSDPGFSVAPLWEYFFRYAMGGKHPLLDNCVDLIQLTELN